MNPISLVAVHTHTHTLITSKRIKNNKYNLNRVIICCIKLT